MLRYLTAGESHGPALVVVVEGLPAGLPITIDEIGAELARRRLGFGRGPRMRFERDDVEFLGGVRHGRTLGSPVSIVIHNTEWPKWQEEMSPAPGVTEKPLTQPRPGHADLVGMQKYGFDDARNVLERASARETAARVAAGALAKALLVAARHDGRSATWSRWATRASPTDAPRPTPADLERIDESPVRCFDPAAEAAMVAAIEAAAKDGDSLGGVVEVLGYGVPPGLGSHVHWDRKHRRAARAGAHEHPGDEGASRSATASRSRAGGAARRTTRSSGTPTTAYYARASDRAGGTEGGMTTGACSSRASR